MEGFTYQNPRINKLKTSMSEIYHEESPSLRELSDRNDINQEKLAHSYHQDLKKLLEKESLHELISAIIEMDHALEKIENLQSGSEIPNLSNFYKCLSPLILRVMKDSLDAQENAESTLNTVKEAIRICIEDELYC